MRSIKFVVPYWPLTKLASVSIVLGYAVLMFNLIDSPSLPLGVFVGFFMIPFLFLKKRVPPPKDKNSDRTESNYKYLDRAL